MSQNEPANRSFKKDGGVASFKATKTSLHILIIEPSLGISVVSA